MTDRPLPPPLELQYPICTLCREEVQHDGDQFVCDNCHATWPDTSIGAERGEWAEPDAEQCDHIDGRFLFGGCYYDARLKRDDELLRCILRAGHRYEHRWSDGYGMRCWGDAGSATANQIAQAQTTLLSVGGETPK